MLYEDTQIIINDEGLEIKRYYFPLGMPKKIKFSEIESVNEIDLYSRPKKTTWALLCR